MRGHTHYTSTLYVVEAHYSNGEWGIWSVKYTREEAEQIAAGDPQRRRVVVYVPEKQS